MDNNEREEEVKSAAKTLAELKNIFITTMAHARQQQQQQQQVGCRSTKTRACRTHV